MFQSTPVIANGRIAITGSTEFPHMRFNPRPLLLTGESTVFAGEADDTVVSIHARYC